MFDASDPGTGKTRSTIEIVRARIRADGRAILVLAPKNLLHNAWHNDIQKFAPELTTSIAYAENREKAFEVLADVYITNHDAANWLAKQPAKFFRRFSTVVMDESGAYKHHTSQRSKSMSKIVRYFDHRIALNGTPNPNTILDAWHQYYLLDLGKRLGKSFFHFRNSVCAPRQVGPMPNMVKWEDREGAEQVVASLVRDITIRHVFEECVDIPENHEYSIPFIMKPKQRRAYEQMKAAAIALLESGTVEAPTASTVTMKLMQISSGAVYEHSLLYHIVDEDRNEMVMDLLEPRQHSLVFFNWKHQKDQLIKAAEKRGYSYCVLDGESTASEKTESVRLFEAGFYKVMFAHPQSAAHGLTLVRATTTIWASPTYNLEHFIQGNKRIYRAGQKHKTETIVIIAENSIDEKVYEALARKKVHMVELLKELKE